MRESTYGTRNRDWQAIGSGATELVTDSDINGLSCKRITYRDYRVKGTRHLYMLEAVFGSVHRFRAMVCCGRTFSKTNNVGNFVSYQITPMIRKPARSGFEIKDWASPNV